MDALACQPFDRLLAEFPQRNAVAGALGLLVDQAEHVAARGIGIHAQQQVGRGKMEEAERVGLHELGAMDQLAQHARRFPESARP